MVSLATAPDRCDASFGFVLPRKTSWADVEVSDNDEEDEIEAQDMCSDVVASVMKKAESESVTSNKQISLFLKDLNVRGGSDADTETVTGWRSDSGSEGSERVRLPTLWEPNMGAPEFIPTQSMDCPLLGFCRSVSEDTSQGCKTPVASTATAAAGVGSSLAVFDMTASHTKSPPEIKVPLRHAASNESCSSWGEIPEASEEDWERREKNRMMSVQIVKESPEYQVYLEKMLSEEQLVDQPETPDPTDRSISKRKWKYLVQQWRQAFIHVADISVNTRE